MLCWKFCFVYINQPFWHNVTSTFQSSIVLYFWTFFIIQLFSCILTVNFTYHYHHHRIFSSPPPLVMYVQPNLAETIFSSAFLSALFLSNIIFIFFVFHFPTYCTFSFSLMLQVEDVFSFINNRCQVQFNLFCTWVSQVFLFVK